FEPAKIDLEGFGTLLNADMRIDLPNYLKQYSSKELTLQTVSDIVAYNKQDSLDKIPYGQGRFEKILDTNLSVKELDQLRVKLHDAGVALFEKTMTEHQLDIILSINNWNAGEAAAANYPCLTVPMGYTATGQPIGITFISRPFQEDMLLKIGYAFEQETKARKLPTDYK
ncbi:MAG: amidase family protein, partial [Flavobacterium sp.]